MAANWSIGLHTQLACIWEATARKAGNVHRFRDFEDVSYLDFLTSAASLGPILALAPDYPLGATISEAVRFRHGVTQTNTNLGIILLLSPLAKAGSSDATRVDLRSRVRRVLDEADVNDSAMTCYGICRAQPGGLGELPEYDVRDEPTLALRPLMALAADRDLVARQYANDFADVFDDGAPALRRAVEETGSLEAAIVRTHLHLMANHPDTLIRRKRGVEEAEESARRARQVLDAGWPQRPEGRDAFAALDDWLRAVGHQRNPGATADLVTACLYVLLRDGSLALPLKVPW
jgi:triphosphoribosyl-dephospho-CoA synthase